MLYLFVSNIRDSYQYLIEATIEMIKQVVNKLKNLLFVCLHFSLSVEMSMLTVQALYLKKVLMVNSIYIHC